MLVIRVFRVCPKVKPIPEQHRIQNVHLNVRSTLAFSLAMKQYFHADILPNQQQYCPFWATLAMPLYIPRSRRNKRVKLLCTTCCHALTISNTKSLLRILFMCRHTCDKTQNNIRSPTHNWNGCPRWQHSAPGSAAAVCARVCVCEPLRFLAVGA